MATRAERRAQAERIKRARRKYWGFEALDCKRLGKAATTAAVCSCWMCGNPRKYFGERTIQERRNMQDVE